MKASKEQVENAILFFAKKFNQEENYTALINSRPVMPKIIEMIVYEMFLQKFNSYLCTEEEYQQYSIIYEYVIELKQIGWVTHEKIN